MCDGEEVPLCVQVCRPGVLTYEEREEEVGKEKPQLGDVEIGIEAMIDKYGLQKVLETIAKKANAQKAKA